MMKTRSKIFVLAFCFLCIAPAFLAAQSTAAEIETLLASDAVTNAQASRFVLEAAGTAAFADPMEAFHFAMERNWLPRNSSPNGHARLDGISLLLMQSFGLRGGILFSITGSPHFAYRELEHKGVIHGRASPRQRVSGDTLLYLTSRVLADTEERLGLAAGPEQQRLFAAAAREALAESIRLQLQNLELYDVGLEVTEEGVMLSLSDILFLADSAEIDPEQRQQLYEIAAILREIPGRIAVAGHTALAGTEESRLEVSAERARAVAGLLVYFGARQAWEIRATGYGAERPVADNDTPEGMAANRRVEITLLEY